MPYAARGIGDTLIGSSALSATCAVANGGALLLGPPDPTANAVVYADASCPGCSSAAAVRSAATPQAARAGHPEREEPHDGLMHGAD